MAHRMSALLAELGPASHSSDARSNSSSATVNTDLTWSSTTLSCAGSSSSSSKPAQQPRRQSANSDSICASLTISSAKKDTATDRPSGSCSPAAVTTSSSSMPSEPPPDPWPPSPTRLCPTRCATSSPRPRPSARSSAQTPSRSAPGEMRRSRRDAALSTRRGDIAQLAATRTRLGTTTAARHASRATTGRARAITEV